MTVLLTLTLLLLLLLPFASGTPGVVTLRDNGYRGLVVSVSPELPPDQAQETVQAIKV